MAQTVMKPWKMSGKLPHRLSTGKLLANMMRSGPNMASTSEMIQPLLSTVHGTSFRPMPDTFTITFSHSARAAMCLCQPASPSCERWAGRPVWLRMMVVSGKSQARETASGRFHHGVCKSNMRPYFSSSS